MLVIQKSRVAHFMRNPACGCDDSFLGRANESMMIQLDKELGYMGILLVKVYHRVLFVTSKLKHIKQNTNLHKTQIYGASTISIDRSINLFIYNIYGCVYLQIWSRSSFHKGSRRWVPPSHPESTPSLNSFDIQQHMCSATAHRHPGQHTGPTSSQPIHSRSLVSR